MNKPKLYCDCDGVLLNTIEVAFQIMRRHGVDTSNRIEVDEYFHRFIDWKEIFKKVEFINNADKRLLYIKEKKIFEDIIILTKLSGGYDEERLKREIFQKALSGIKVVTLQYGLNKGLVVPAKDNVLVDDEIGNYHEWQKEEGVPILFSPYMFSLENNIINDLSDLTNTAGVKKLLKTRNF